MKNLIEFAKYVENIFISTDFLQFPEKADYINKDWIISKKNINLESGKYLDPNIVESIYNNYNTSHSKIIKYNGLDIHFEFYDVGKNLRMAKYFLGYVCFLINLLNTFNHLNKTLKLTLIYYNGKKVIPEDGIFKSCNVNSGLTYCYSNDYAEITVYREEEMVKVLTHEMIHFYDIDSKYIHGGINEDKLDKFFCLKDGLHVNVNEAFTESLACLINIVMYTILQNKTNNLFAKTLKENYEKEIQYSRGQAYKVLKTSKFDVNCTKLNSEQTHAISYYVIKAIIINNSEDFLDYLKANNFRLKDRSSFVSFILNKLKGINCTLFGKTEYDGQIDKNSMRMTLLDTIELMNVRKVYKAKSNP